MPFGPPPLTLPDRCVSAVDELGAVCDLIEDVVAHNAHVRVPFASGDMRRMFMTERQDSVQKVGTFAEEVLALCPKTWPCVLWMCDRVAKTCDLPLTATTARRLLTAGVFLVLSTEDDDLEELARIAKKNPAKLEYLGWGLLQLLRDIPALDNTPEGRRAPVPADTRDWEDVVGMPYVGMIRGNLPTLVKAAQRGAGPTAVTHVLNGHAYHGAAGANDDDSVSASNPASAATSTVIPTPVPVPVPAVVCDGMATFAADSPQASARVTGPKAFLKNALRAAPAKLPPFQLLNVSFGKKGSAGSRRESFDSATFSNLSASYRTIDSSMGDRSLSRGSLSMSF